MHQAGILPRPWDPFLSFPLLTTKPRRLLPVPTWPWCLLADQEHTTHATWAHRNPGACTDAWSFLPQGRRQAVWGSDWGGERSALGLDPWVLPWL